MIDSRFAPLAARLRAGSRSHGRSIAHQLAAPFLESKAENDICLARDLVYPRIFSTHSGGFTPTCSRLLGRDASTFPDCERRAWFLAVDLERTQVLGYLRVVAETTGGSRSNVSGIRRCTAGLARLPRRRPALQTCEWVHLSAHLRHHPMPVPVRFYAAYRSPDCKPQSCQIRPDFAHRFDSRLGHRRRVALTTRLPEEAT